MLKISLIFFSWILSTHCKCYASTEIVTSQYQRNAITQQVDQSEENFENKEETINQKYAKIKQNPGDHFQEELRKMQEKTIKEYTEEEINQHKKYALKNVLEEENLSETKIDDIYD